MYKFTVQTDRSMVIATIDVSTSEEFGEVVYQEILNPEEFSILEDLKGYIIDRGGLYMGIEPDCTSPADLNHALTTTYSHPLSFVPSFTIESVDVEGEILPAPALPEGCLY
jgi:hypothetical protein